MDPNANIAEQREIADALIALADSNRDSCNAVEIAERAQRLAELVIALDDWIRGGGCLPAAWENRRPTPRRT